MTKSSVITSALYFADTTVGRTGTERLPEAKFSALGEIDHRTGSYACGPFHAGSTVCQRVSAGKSEAALFVSWYRGGE